MKFTDAGDVRTVVEQMRINDERLHSWNRARIDALFNGEPPFSETEAEENNIDCNANFLEGTNIVHRARSTWNNAFLKTGNAFSITQHRGPRHKREEISAKITSYINRPIKNSLRYVETHRATGAQVVLHGIGPKQWKRPGFWCPSEVGIQNLLVPSGTRVNLDNLSYYALDEEYTPGELFRLTHRQNRDPGWRMKVVQQELARCRNEMLGQPTSRDYSSPEKLVEWYKANGGLIDSDRAPVIRCWSFFYQESDDLKGEWYRKVILQDAPGSGPNDFIYSSKRPWAGDLSQILHIQFGDGANVAPFLYHSVRSLGFLLYAVLHIQNRLRCRFMDAIFEATLQYFRNVSEADRAKLQKVDLMHMGLLPEGLQLVPQAERWQINGDLVVAGLSQNRQLMSESASSFIQDIDNPMSTKELTATEVMARLNNANALVASLLSMAYTYYKFECVEIARRFTLKHSRDPDVIEFRRRCLTNGVPEECLDVEHWDIEVERVMGGGNKTLELAQARSLMEIKPQLDPPAQRVVLRKYILAIGDDPDLALSLVPEDKRKATPASMAGQMAFGALMADGEVDVPETIDRIVYVEALFSSLLGAVEDSEQLQARGELPSGQQIIGYLNVIQHLQKNIALIAQDPKQKVRVKEYQDALANVTKLVNGYAQRVDEKRQAEQQNNADMAKAQATMMEAQAKTQIAAVNAQQKRQHKELSFRQDQTHKQAKAQQELASAQAKTQVEVQSVAKKTSADVLATTAKTAAQVKAIDAKAKAAEEAREETAVAE